MLMPPTSIHPSQHMMQSRTNPNGSIKFAPVQVNSLWKVIQKHIATEQSPNQISIDNQTNQPQPMDMSGSIHQSAQSQNYDQGVFIFIYICIHTYLNT
jgi:hypothetical protein